MSRNNATVFEKPQQYIGESTIPELSSNIRNISNVGFPMYEITELVNVGMYVGLRRNLGIIGVRPSDLRTLFYLLDGNFDSGDMINNTS